MPSEEGRRKKQPVRYEILLIPQGDGGKKRSFYASRVRLWVFGLMTFGLVVAVVVLLLVYTPVAMYIPIKNPELEQHYGKQILETQQQLNDLAQDVLVLRDYNQQLRKALGEFNGKDSSASKASVVKSRERQAEPIAVEDSGYVATPDENTRTSEAYGDYDVGPGSYGTVQTSHEGFRGELPLLSPTQGFVTQGFDPTLRHFGVDYAVKRGTPVYAATDGYVLFSGWTYDDGNMIMLSHGGGYLTVYKHNQLLLKSTHAFVRRGDLIAQSGSTGQTSAGPHLHFELWRDGIPRDPQEYLLTAARIQ